MKTAGLATLLLAVGAAGRDDPADQAAKDAAALKGKWEIVSSEFEGQPATDAYRPGTVIVFEADTFYFTDGFAKSAGTKFKLDAAAKPKTIDMGSDKEKGGVSKGIYALDKDSLKLCLSLDGERPKEFKTKAGDKTNYFVLKRQKP